MAQDHNELRIIAILRNRSKTTLPFPIAHSFLGLQADYDLDLARDRLGRGSTLRDYDSSSCAAKVGWFRLTLLQRFLPRYLMIYISRDKLNVPAQALSSDQLIPGHLTATDGHDHVTVLHHCGGSG